VPVTTALGSNADVAEEVIESGACPLLAQSGHPDTLDQCPLLGVKRTCKVSGLMSAFDPKRTLASPNSRNAI
jgi:hypothetical protein